MPWLRLVSGSHSSHIDLASLCRCNLQQLWPDGLDSITMSEHSPFFSSHLALHFFNPKHLYAKRRIQHCFATTWKNENLTQMPDQFTSNWKGRISFRTGRTGKENKISTENLR